jgi:hypothetical protein
VYFAVDLSQQDNPEGANSSGPAIPPREHQAIVQPNLEFLFGHSKHPQIQTLSLATTRHLPSVLGLWS